MPAYDSCCVPGCTNQKNFCKWGLFATEDGEIVRKRLCGAEGKGGCKNTSTVCKELSFHRLPANKELRRTWIVKIHRDNTPVTPNTRVCGVHFDGGRRRDTRSIPTTFLWSKLVKKRLSRVSSAAGTLADSEVDMEVDGAVNTAYSAGTASPETSDQEDTHEEEGPAPWEGTNMREYIKSLEDRIKQLEAGYLKVRQELADERNNVTKLKDALSAADAKVSSLQDELDSQQLSYARMKTRPDLIKFYTGIDTEAMEFLLHLVGDAAQESCRHNVQDTSTFDGHDSRGRKRKLKPEDELLLTLCKLRHNFPQDDLAMRFCVNQSTVSRIFSCWTEILEACVNEFPLWPDKISVQEEMPAAFQNLYLPSWIVNSFPTLE